MGGNPALGNLVHLPGANLHLDTAMVRADDGRVERLIIVLLGG